jgi:hypothetical protein
VLAAFWKVFQGAVSVPAALSEPVGLTKRSRAEAGVRVARARRRSEVEAREFMVFLVGDKRCYGSSILSRWLYQKL